jgi:hypothetical protein
MKHILIILATCFINTIVLAQKNHGINWVQGGLKTDKINFSNNPPIILPYKEPLYLDQGTSCISDTLGRLRLVCNG